MPAFRLGLIVNGDEIAVWIGERERPPERPIDRRGSDRHVVGGERIMQLLRVGGVQPQRYSDAALGDNSIQIDIWQRDAHRKGDRLSREDNGVGRAGLSSQAKVLLQALMQEGVVTRPDSAPSGRALPVELTARGHEQLAVASAAIRRVDDAMLSGLTDAARQQLREHLASCVESLRAHLP